MRTDRVFKACFCSPHAFGFFDPSIIEPVGGSEVRAYTLANTLNSLGGNSISMFVLSHGQLETLEFDGIEVFSSKKFGVHGGAYLDQQISQQVSAFIRIINGIDNRILSNRLASRARRKAVRSALNNISADIFCTFGVSWFSDEVIQSAAKMKRKVVLFLGSDADVRPDIMPDGGWRIRHRCLAAADVIIAQTSRQYNFLPKNSLERARIIPNPISLKRGKGKCDAEVRRSSGPLLWIGKADRIKNPLDAIEVASAFTHRKMKMVLNSADPIIEATVRNNAPDNVEFIRYVPLDDMENVIAEAGLLINTSLYEGFPNSFIQAAKYGVPIASLNADPEGMLIDSGAGFCAQGSLQNLCMGIENLLEDRLAYTSAGDAGVKIVDSNHDALRIAEIVQACFKETIERNPT